MRHRIAARRELPVGPEAADVVRLAVLRSARGECGARLHRAIELERTVDIAAHRHHAGGSNRCSFRSRRGSGQGGPGERRCPTHRYHPEAYIREVHAIFSIVWSLQNLGVGLASRIRLASLSIIHVL